MDSLLPRGGQLGSDQEVVIKGKRLNNPQSIFFYNPGISVEELRSKYGSVSSIPLGRSGKLTEVADLVVYLASDRASYLHGTTVNLSGGKSRG